MPRVLAAFTGLWPTVRRVCATKAYLCGNVCTDTPLLHGRVGWVAEQSSSQDACSRQWIALRARDPPGSHRCRSKRVGSAATQPTKPYLRGNRCADRPLLQACAATAPPLKSKVSEQKPHQGRVPFLIAPHRVVQSNNQPACCNAAARHGGMARLGSARRGKTGLYGVLQHGTAPRAVSRARTSQSLEQENADPFSPRPTLTTPQRPFSDTRQYMLGKKIKKKNKKNKNY